MPLAYLDHCRQAALTRAMVDRFLDAHAHNYAAFDPVLGYRLRDCVVRDGLDDANVIYRYEPTGERKRINYADRPCRINTYGNSFTQCHQVGDGETWQEVLAAHLGEPIRNWGIGGYGAYQAYRRLLTVEAGPQRASHLLLNLFSDDHVRNLLAWRWLVIRPYWQVVPRDTGSAEASMFHANPWAHLSYDPDTDSYVERPNLCPTPESLYRLCDADWIVETFRHDWVAQALHLIQGGVGCDNALLMRYSEAFGVKAKGDADAGLEKVASKALRRCSLRSTLWILKRLRAWAIDHDRALLIALSYGEGDVLGAIRGEPRDDAPLLDALERWELPWFDGLAAHVEDYGAFRLSPGEYVRRYYIGHYAPSGNHFFAHAIKDAMVRWLAPPPPAYRRGGASLTEITRTLA